MIELYELIEKTKEYNEIIIFGYYHIGQIVFEELHIRIPKKIICFCDNNIEKQKINNVESVNGAVSKYPNAMYVVVNLYHGQAMREQLQALGISSRQIDIYVPYQYRVEMEYAAMIRRRTPLPELQFEVDLAEHCNLNCKYCDHFSPLAQQKFPEYLEFSSDIERLSVLFRGRAKRIFLLGGEPLLNKNITKFMDCTRKNFPFAKIAIITNGLLLMKMREDFWITCREKNIQILITKYPMEFEYEKITKKCEKEDVSWEYMGDSKICKYSYHFPLDVTGQQNARESFLHCANANECITLKKGKLYTCSVAPNINHFNEYFNKEIELLEEDGIDIYQTDSAQTILDFLSKPIPFCRYCDISRRTYDNKWAISNRDIKEWT